MKVNLGSITGITMVTMLLLSMFMLPTMAGDPLVTHTGNVMWIESDDPRDLDPDPQVIKFETGDIKPGEEFTIIVWLNMEVDVFAWQFVLTFCSSLVQCTDAGSTSPPTSQYMEGHTTTYTGPIINNVDDYVKAGETCLGTDFVPGPHHGSLCWMNFTFIASPGKEECLTCAFKLSETYPDDTWVWDPDLSQVLDSVEDCPISYNWTPPDTLPHMAVHNPGAFPGDPKNCTTEWFFGRDGNATGDPWNCTWFPVDIYICNLDPAWGLTNASFCLCYDDTELYTALDGSDITIENPPWSENITTVIDGMIEFFVECPCGVPAIYIEDFPKNNSVKVATVMFHIFDQGFYPDVDVVDLTFCCDTIFYNHESDITADPPQEGTVTIEGYLTMELPWLEVIDPEDGDHEIVMGPEPCICKTFDVEVWIKNLDVRWRAVAFEFKLGYTEVTSVDPLYIEVACPLAPCVEGDWLPGFANPPNTPDNGTWYICIDVHDMFYPPYHIKTGYLLLPNMSSGEWTVFPEGEGILFTIKFHVEYQSYPLNFTAPLTIYDILLVNDEGDDIPFDPPVNGIVHITTALPGREIDLYTQYPDPFGGQGPHQPSDMFWPQKIVYLYTKVTYNYWPVNNKDVGFEVEGPFDQETGEKLPRYKIWLKASARTNKNGIAWIKFQLPWPCHDPEGLFGKWKVTATVDICCTVINDTLKFDYNYVVVWKDVIVDRQEEPEYNHCETVEITVKFKSKAQQKRWVLISAVLEDELQTPVGIALTGLFVGGAKPCHYVQYEVVLRIHVPQHAFAGIAHLLVNAFTKDPTIGGVPWCPQFTCEPRAGTLPYPEVWIQPY